MLRNLFILFLMVFFISNTVVVNLLAQVQLAEQTRFKLLMLMIYFTCDTVWEEKTVLHVSTLCNVIV